MGPKLEINPSAVYTTPPTTGWVDISASVDWTVGVSITAGRADESSQVTPGQLNLVLNNITGNFTPGNTSSIYYPDITIPLWMRYTSVDATVGFSTVEFTGLATSWVPDLVGPNAERIVKVQAQDEMNRMNKFRQIRTPLFEECMLDNPLAFYPMDDGSSGSGSYADQSGNLQPPLQVMSIGATGAFNSTGATGPPGTGGQAPNFQPDLSQITVFNANGHGKYLYTNLTQGLPVGNGNAYTIEWWQLINTDGVNLSASLANYPGMVLFENPPATNGSLYGGIYSSAAAFQPPDSGGPPYEYGGAQMILRLGTNIFGGNMAVGCSGSLNPGVWYHFAITCDGGTSTVASAKFYMNGHFMGANGQTVPRTTMDPPPAGVRTLTYLVLAGLPLFGGMLLDGSVAYAALYKTALSQPRLLEHYIAGRNGFHGETVRDRAVRLLKYAGLGDQSASAAMEPANTPVVNQQPAAALSMLHDLETTEQGLFLIAPDGTPTFYARGHRFTSAVLTLDAAPGTGNLGQGDTQPVLDDQRLLNDVTTTTGLATSYRAINSASVAANGTYQQSINTVAASPTNADETSRWIVAGQSTPQLRIPTIKIDILTQPGIRAAVVAAKVWDRIRLTNLSTGYVFADMAIEGIQKSYSQTNLDVTFTVAPNAAATGTTYTIGVAGLDEIDTSPARLGF